MNIRGRLWKLERKVAKISSEPAIQTKYDYSFKTRECFGWVRWLGKVSMSMLFENWWW